MRKLKINNTSDNTSGFVGLTDEKILELGAQLDQKAMLHIENVYFARNGAVSFDCHQYRVDGKLKDYRMIRVEEVPVVINGGHSTKMAKVPHPDDEIVFVITAEELVDKYAKLKNKNKK